MKLRIFSVAIAAAVLVSGCVLKRAPTPSPPVATAASQPTASSVSAPDTVRLSSNTAPTAAPRQQVERRGPILNAGNGVFIDPSKAVKRGNSRASGGDISLNFVDTDLREVLNVVLGDTLGLNYAVDPKVKGKVTVRTSRPLKRSAVLGAVEDILALNGAAMIERDGFYNILPAANAGKAGLFPELAGMPSGPGTGLRIVPLQHISAQRMADILEPFVANGRTLLPDRDRNLLLLTGTSQELASLTGMVETFDVEWLAGMSFGLFPISSGNPAEVAKDLEAIFGDPDSGPLAGRVRLVPIERINALLVVTQKSDYLAMAQEWIENLDDGGSGSAQRLYVYYVENRRAEDLAPVLNDVFSGGLKTQDQSSVAPRLTPKTIATGGARPQKPLSGKALSGKAPTRPAGVRTPAAPVAGVGGVGRGVGFAQEAEIRIIADTKKNALLILANPSDYRVIESALKKLDVVPLQVLIEASILEVTLNDTLKYGVQWYFESGNSSVTLSTAGDGAVASRFPGFSYFFNTPTVRATIDLLDTVTDVQVVSSPQLMVLDNETASLQVGDQVPVATQSAVSSVDPSSPIVNSIQMLDTGVILEVTPRVNANGLVILDILQEVSDAVSTTTSTIDSPTVRKRRIKSSVAVQSGETIALGGMIKDTDDLVTNGIPLLMDLPILGNLFKTTTDTTKRTELLILLTPRVVRDSSEMRQATQELRRKLSRLKALERKGGQ